MFAIAIIFCITSLIIVSMYLSHKAKVSSPQHTCSHDMVVTQTWNGQRSNEYLSTCRKCGHQTTHFFSGTNHS